MIPAVRASPLWARAAQMVLMSAPYTVSPAMPQPQLALVCRSLTRRAGTCAHSTDGTTNPSENPRHAMQVVDATCVVEVSIVGKKGLELGVPKHATQGTIVLRADQRQ